MRVLFIDEDEDSVADGIALLEELGYNCKRIEFNALNAILPEYQPDIIVLDMMDGGRVRDPDGVGGQTSFNTIWDTKFCPIVVYSANPDLIDDIGIEKTKNPLVRKIQKGSGSDENLREEINKLKPCVDGINGIINDVNATLQVTLKKVATHIVSQDGIDEIAIAIQHMGRRRLAATMDDLSLLRPKFHPCEQYIYPPLEDYPKLGDLILDTAADTKLPDSFRVILTPSCDLVNKGAQKPKVEKVLCARCENPELLLLKVSRNKRREIKQNLPSLLTQGHIDECLPLPEFQGVIPPMVANLKKLELISYESIKNEEGDGVKFVRVASVDSPFREQIAWAYINTGGRPGVPDRDFECWAKQYLDYAKGKGEKT
jgi:CTP synthase